MTRYTIFVCIILMLTVFSEGQRTVMKLEAENMTGDLVGTTVRASASGLKAVHLFKGNEIRTELCLMSNTELEIEEVAYSNDGESDRVQVSLDANIVGTFETVVFMDGGRGWEQYQPSKSMTALVNAGRHILTLTVLDSDRYGVEIDFIKIRVNNSQAPDSLRCHVFCFDGIDFPYQPSSSAVSRPASAVQKSVKTKCAEEDNINIPVFHESAQEFDVIASLPKYKSFQNNRGADWTDCKMASAFWSYRDVVLTKGHEQFIRSGASVLRSNSSQTGISGPTYVIDVSFDLDGPAIGSADSEVGTRVYLRNVHYSGKLAVQFQYFNRYNTWSHIDSKLLSNNERTLEFHTPDFSFREGSGNKIRIELYVQSNSSDDISVEELYMVKRYLKHDRSFTLFKNDITVIEGVDMDMWWRINETMSVTVTDHGQTFNDVDYIRIYKRVPWSVNGYSQVFVMYQDGNVRLLPTTPHGLDWIPFGSSVILGQTNPTSNRPCAPITHLEIHPDTLHLKIFYKDGGVLPLQITTTIEETKLHVTGSHYVRDTNLYPFFTFRSMFVKEGNNDVDHVSVDGRQTRNILDTWETLRGHYFAFYRKCISKHNTQSPDISLYISG